MHQSAMINVHLRMHDKMGPSKEMTEIWKKIKHFPKNIIHIIFMSLNSQAGFFFTEECLLTYKWFIIPDDFMNKQYFQQQVANCLQNCSTKNILNRFKPGINKVGPFKLFYFNHTEEKSSFAEVDSFSYLTFDV